ncbi:hypothetical protein VTJ04DRAFT_4602 [Mycothermus thermophilus]|uniref:uncharacterized protein n=1 Tax=Humicola insolens TaxID=85995 RepID=UPI0037420BDD
MRTCPRSRRGLDRRQSGLCIITILKDSQPTMPSRPVLFRPIYFPARTSSPSPYSSPSFLFVVINMS